MPTASPLAANGANSANAFAASGGVVKLSPFEESQTDRDITWLNAASLQVVVIGASGDLAMKKTYPALLELFDDNLLPDELVIWGFARTQMTDDQLRDKLRPKLLNSRHSANVVN
eukprot:Selendium_serpulae@DN7873_c0_g1_i1.p1